MGKPEQAMAQILRANELDPLSLIASAEIGWAAYYARSFSEAERACKKTLEMDANFMFAIQCLEFTMVVQKKPEAIAVAEKLVSLAPGDPYLLGQLGWAYGALGHKEKARDILATLAKMDSVPPTSTLWVHVGLGDRDRALADLEKVHQERWGDIVWMKAGPEFDSLRSDARFTELLREMAFEQ